MRSEFAMLEAHLMKLRFVATLSIASLLAVGSVAVNAGQPVVVPAASARFAAGGPVAGHVLVKFRPGTTSATAASVEALVHARAISHVPDLGVRVLSVPLGAEESVVAALSHRRDVQFAELDFAVHALDTTPNDAYYPSQKSQSYSQVRVGLGWDATVGLAGPLVAVVDTGVDADHPDLAAKVSADGWNFVANNSNTADDEFHGTMVAGIIGASSNNTTGITGLCWGCRILPVKVLDASGSGSTSNVASGVTYAVDHGAKVINLSLGGSGSSTLKAAVDYAIGKGAIVVAAAGNSTCNCVTYPAAYPEVIAVGAVDKTNANVASWGATLDVVAPGSNWSTYYSATYPTLQYAVLTGTSSAAPVVSGLAALLLAQDPTRNQAAVVSQITSTALDLGSAGRDDTYGYGLIDFAAALGAAPVQGPASPSPSPSPSGTPSPSASPTPSPTPTATPTASPTPTPAPTASPTPTPTPAPTASPTTTPAPTMTTATYNGSVNNNQSSRSYTIVAGTGTASAALKTNKGATLTLSVTAPDGSVLATSQSAAPSIQFSVTGGTYTILVTSSGGKSNFTLTVTYPS